MRGRDSTIMVPPSPSIKKPPLFLKVMAITNESDKDGRCTTSHTYCTPSSKIWITEEGLEDPDSDILIIVELHIPRSHDLQKVEFEYDGGKYVGYLETISNALPASLTHFPRSLLNLMVLENISSL